MTSIYVASSFSRKEDVRAAMAALQAEGHSITHDWTQEDTEGKTGAALESYLGKCAIADFNGVEFADVLLLLNDSRAFGAMVELGMALQAGKRVMVVAPDARDCIFFKLPEVELYPTLSDAIEALRLSHLQDLDDVDALDEADW